MIRRGIHCALFSLLFVGIAGSAIAQDQVFSLLGRWEVISDAGSGYVTALTDEKAAEVIGTIVEYAPTYFQVNDERVENPVYTFDWMSTLDLHRWARMSLTDIDVEAEGAWGVTIDAFDVYSDSVNVPLFASYVLMVDSDTVFGHWLGGYFEMHRLADDS